jgi:hypothetical protein
VDKTASALLRVWLRGGNTGSTHGATALLTEFRALLPPHLRLTLIRADSGFFEEEIVLALKVPQLPHIIVGRFKNQLQAAVYRLAFRPFAPGEEVGEPPYQSHRRTRARRLIVIREELARRPAARGRELFHAPGYRFHAVVPTLAGAPEVVWRTYNGRRRH